MSCGAAEPNRVRTAGEAEERCAQRGIGATARCTGYVATAFNPPRVVKDQDGRRYRFHTASMASRFSRIEYLMRLSSTVLRRILAHEPGWGRTPFSGWYANELLSPPGLNAPYNATLPSTRTRSVLPDRWPDTRMLSMAKSKSPAYSRQEDESPFTANIAFLRSLRRPLEIVVRRSEFVSKFRRYVSRRSPRTGSTLRVLCVSSFSLWVW